MIFGLLNCSLLLNHEINRLHCIVHTVRTERDTENVILQNAIFAMMHDFGVLRDGKQTSAEGDAYIPDKKDAARLKLRFASG